MTCQQDVCDWLRRGSACLLARCRPFNRKQQQATTMDGCFCQSNVTWPAALPPIMLCVSSMFDVTLTVVNTHHITHSFALERRRFPLWVKEHKPPPPPPNADVTSCQRLCVQSMNQAADDEILSQMNVVKTVCVHLHRTSVTFFFLAFLLLLLSLHLPFSQFIPVFSILWFFSWWTRCSCTSKI